MATLMNTIAGSKQVKSMGTDDFYVVLPSNACAKVHPENTANNYRVSWEAPLEFHEDDWRVALIEANFSHVVSFANSNFGIRYYYEVPSLKWVWGRLHYKDRDVQFTPDDSSVDLSTAPKFRIDDEYRLDAYSNSYWFKLSFPGQAALDRYGLVNERYQQVDGKGYPITSVIEDGAHRIRGEKLQSSTLSIRYFGIGFFAPGHTETIVKERHITSDELNVDDVHDMVRAIYEKNLTIEHFKLSWADDNRHVKIECVAPLKRVELLNGLNVSLGFKDVIVEGTRIAEYEPYGRLGINNLYIYASICTPIRVGEVCVPLLKSLWFDVIKRKYNLGETRNVVVKHPMYMPVCGKSINTIEVNIRTDSGELVPFIGGSVTSLTLHFSRL